MLLACVNSTVLDASIKEGIDYETVRRIIDRFIATIVRTVFEGGKVSGVAAPGQFWIR